MIRNEPTVHDVILQDALSLAKFMNCGWLDYFLKLDSFNEDIALEFAQTLSDGKEMVKGLEFMATEETIVEVIGLSIEGESYPTSRNVRSARENFTKPSDPPPVVDKQGTRRTSLLENWKQVVVYIIKYITYEGHQSFLHYVHFKLLNHMRCGRRINVPNVLYNLLAIMVVETQKGRDNSISHHCLIKILLEKYL